MLPSAWERGAARQCDLQPDPCHDKPIDGWLGDRRARTKMVPSSGESTGDTALNLSLSALGNIRTESLRAFSAEEMGKIVAKMS